ncbi:hypothetical protein DHW03_09515 [Pedobacter yonginense]|uniref:Bacteriocin n=1 Tax=Pedobacter yonginense TaxID=651869 RepID=A0A317EMH4_9SPHI|nr:hypothetical protein [Pedobacter yonginense]PWS27804.1 hypothetical protein DHW03_09515 [Pedobacter yonginense]
MKNLSKTEMIEIEGGSLFADNASAMNVSFTSNADCLLSLTFERNYGNQHSKTTISAGNDVNLNFGFASNQ